MLTDVGYAKPILITKYYIYREKVYECKVNFQLLVTRIVSTYHKKIHMHGDSYEHTNISINNAQKIILMQEISQ